MRLAMYAVGAILIGYFVGMGDAAKEEKYFVAEQYPDYVVASISAETAIFVAFDDKAKRLCGKFVIVPIGSPLNLQSKKIGRLSKSDGQCAK